VNFVSLGRRLLMGRILTSLLCNNQSKLSIGSILFDPSTYYLQLRPLSHKSDFLNCGHAGLTNDYLYLRLRPCRIAKRKRRSRKRKSAAVKPFWAVLHSQHPHVSLKGCACDSLLREHDLNPDLAFHRRTPFRKDIHTNVAYVACYALSLKLAAFGVFPKERHRNLQLIPNGASSFQATFHYPFHSMSFVFIATQMGHRDLAQLLSCTVQNEAVHYKLQIILVACVFLLPRPEGVFSNVVLPWHLAGVGNFR